MAEADTDKNKFIREIDYAIREFKESSPETKDSKKNALFQKLFELMTFECGRIWAHVLTSHHYTQKLGSRLLTTPIQSPLDQLNRIFYSKSKWIKMDGSKDYYPPKKDDSNEELARLVNESYRIEAIPSKLFLEFLLFVATKIRDTPRTDTTQLSCLGTLVRQSDQESVLYIAQEIDSFFIITPDPATNEIFQQILAIYTACGVTFTGNISISHIIGQLCEGITGTGTGTGMQTASSQSLVKPLELRSDFEQMLLNGYKVTESIVQTGPPLVKGGIVKPGTTGRPAVVSKSQKAQSGAIQKTTCPYGLKCYRRGNIQHENEYSHPKFKPTWKPGGGSGKSKRTRRHSSTKRAKRSTRRHRRR